MHWSVALLLLLLLTPPWAVRGDPAITRPGLTEGLAQWTFSNPSNYTLTGVSLGPSSASLGWTVGRADDTTQADFTLAKVLVNVDLGGTPGDVAIADTTQPGPIQNLTYQADPSQVADNYLYKGNGGNPNFGSSSDLRVGNYGGSEWNRGILRIPALPLPSNATLRTAQLQLYMHAYNGSTMDIGAYRITSPWTEMGSNWNTRDGVSPWNTTGGDFDPAAVDTVAVIGSTLGWYTWNITPLTQGWWNGTIPNQGVMLREVDDTVNTPGVRYFYSSDTSNPTLRPQLLFTYTTPSSRGTLESRIIDAGIFSQWGSLWWNTTLYAGTSLSIQTRTGGSSVIDASWGPWSQAYSSAGAAIANPWARYLQYRVSLFTPTATSPRLHDVSLGYGHYPPSGTVATEAITFANLTGWGRLEVNWSGPVGSDVTVAFSQDGGASWAPALPTTNLSSALPQALVLRLTLATANTTRAPTVQDFALGFAFAAPNGGGGNGGGGGGGNLLPGGLPWWLLLLPIALLPLFLVAGRLRRGHFRPTDLFLIHGDGRLVLRVGIGANPLEDEVAVSGMFTLVARFVKDSFGGSQGSGGELKSLRVDQREVAIAKGEYLFLALVAEGDRPPELEATMVTFLGALEVSHAAALRDWDGFGNHLGDIRASLQWFLAKGYRRPGAKFSPGSKTG